jgi:hypothetical protein
MAYILWFLDLLRSIPDVVWSGVIASVLTLSGVLISNSSNTKRLRMQLDHDGAQKARDRVATLRREVCLEAVAQLTEANSFLASLPQTDPSKKNLADGLKGFFSAAAKLQLVVEPDTALLVNKLVAGYSELLLRPMVRVAPLHRLTNRIEIHDKLYNESQAQVTRVLGEMSKFNEAAEVDSRVFEALQRSFDGYQEQASFQANERSRAWDEFNSLNIQFCRQLLEELGDVVAQQIAVVVEIRRDLGLDSNLDAFRTQMEEQRLRITSQLEELFKAVQEGR